MEELESQPEVAEEGREASMAYMSSGYTDLDNAKKAQESYEKSSTHDQEVLRELEMLNRPDKEAEAIADDFYNGVKKVDEGNAKFAEDLSKAPDQTVEERAATAQNIEPAMSLYAEGMQPPAQALVGPPEIRGDRVPNPHLRGTRPVVGGDEIGVFSGVGYHPGGLEDRVGDA